MRAWNACVLSGSLMTLIGAAAIVIKPRHPTSRPQYASLSRSAGQAAKVLLLLGALLLLVGLIGLAL